MEISRYWRIKAQRYRLEASTCPICGRISFPPRPICPYCSGQPALIAAEGFPVRPTSMRMSDVHWVEGG